MTITKKICDCCGKELENDVKSYDFNLLANNYRFHSHQKLELCQECNEKYEIIVSNCRKEIGEMFKDNFYEIFNGYYDE